MKIDRKACLDFVRFWLTFAHVLEANFHGTSGLSLKASAAVKLPSGQPPSTSESMQPIFAGLFGIATVMKLWGRFIDGLLFVFSAILAL